MSRTRILVTGASGFVGSHLCRVLVDRDWEIHGLRAGTKPLPDDSDFSGIAFHEVGGDRRYQQLRGVMQELRPDVVVHLASLFIAEHTADDVPQLLGANITYGSELLEAMSRAGVQKFVNTGTSWQQFVGSGYHPTCLYAAQKEAFEKIVDYYVEAEGFTAVTLRLYDTYGPFDHRAKLFHALRRAACGARLALSPGDQWLELVHIDDVCAAFLLEIDRLLQGETSGHPRYALYADRSYSLKEVVGLWEAAVGHKLDVHFGEREYRRREIMNPVKELPRPEGWKPLWNLPHGMDQMLAADPIRTDAHS